MSKTCHCPFCSKDMDQKNRWNHRRIKPETDLVCLVVHAEENPGYILKALYHADTDTFILLEHNSQERIPLDVTHWIEIPVVPTTRCATTKATITHARK